MQTPPLAARDPADPRFRRGRRQFIAIAVFFCVLFVAAMIVQLIQIQQRKAALRGDGHDPATYGFDLSNLTVDRSVLVGALMAKDQTPAICDPTPVTLDNAGDLKKPGPRYASVDVLDQIAAGPGGAFRIVLVSADRVIGLTVNGESRCYPLRFIRWHEIVNDTLGEQPVVVTYSPLTDSAAAFDRRVGGDTLTFGHAGLMYNSNLVMYDDREADADESLWSQLAMSPIAGPAVARGDSLAALPIFFGSWEQWRRQHPDTAVMVGDVRFKDRYKKDPFARSNYFEQKRPWFPVKPTPPADGIDGFTPLVAWRDGETWRWQLASADASSIPAHAPRAYSLWFAWYAIRESH